MSAARDLLEDRAQAIAVRGDRDRHRGQDVHDEHHRDGRVGLREDRGDLSEILGPEPRPADRRGKKQARDAALSQCASRVGRESGRRLSAEAHGSLALVCPLFDELASLTRS